jgi:hypothetical protein
MMISHKEETLGEKAEGREHDQEKLWDAIYKDGGVVGTKEWDSGGPGAGAETVYVYVYRGAFYSSDDVANYGPFDTFFEAADVVGLFHLNEAMTSLWIDPEFRNDAVAGRLMQLLKCKTMEVEILKEALDLA